MISCEECVWIFNHSCKLSSYMPIERAKNLGSPWLQKMTCHLSGKRLSPGINGDDFLTKKSRVINTNKIVFKIPIEYSSIKCRCEMATILFRSQCFGARANDILVEIFIQSFMLYTRTFIINFQNSDSRCSCGAMRQKCLSPSFREMACRHSGTKRLLESMAAYC